MVLVLHEGCLAAGDIRPCGDISDKAKDVNPNDPCSCPVAGQTERLQAICQSIDGPPRDVNCLPGIAPLELLLAIPHSIAAAPTEAWVRQDASGLLEPP